MSLLARLEGLALVDALTCSPIVYRGEPCLTFDLIDRAHGKSQAAKSAFRHHEDRFAEGVHFFRVPHADLVGLPKSVRETLFDKSLPRRGVTFLTRRGYARIAKVFTDDLAWDVQDKLEDAYFGAGSEEKPQVPAAPMSRLDMIQAMLDELRAQSEATARAEAKAEGAERIALELRDSYEEQLPKRGEVEAGEVARRYGWFSRNGKPHHQAVLAAARMNGFSARGYVRSIQVRVDLERWGTKYLFTPQGVKEFATLNAPFATQDTFAVRFRDRSYQVRRTGGAS